MKKVIKHKKNNVELSYYLQDEELYTIWKYLNGYRLAGKNLLTFDDITARIQNRFSVVSFIYNLNNLNINTLKGLIFHKDIYFKYYPKYNELKNKAKNNEFSGLVFKAFELAEKVISDNFTLDDIKNLALFYENILRMLEFFEFSTNLFPKDRKKLSSFINAYIKKFIEDKLIDDRKNYYKFEKQKQTLLYDLKKNTEKYGNRFITEYGEETDEANIVGIDKEYLFIHSLIALEHLKYINVDDIWVFDMDLPPEKQKDNYKVAIAVKQKYFSELKNKSNGNKSRKTIKIKQDTYKTHLNPDDGVLVFKNKKIEISKSKNTNPYFLLKTLFKDKTKTWDYDEIYEEMFGEEYDKSKWKRIYNSAYDVNEKIAKETTIKDFLDFTKTTIKIKDKYLQQ